MERDNNANNEFENFDEQMVQQIGNMKKESNHSAATLQKIVREIKFAQEAWPP